MDTRIDTMVRTAVAGLLGVAAETVTRDDVLMGPGARLKSRDLVMLTIEVEDFMLETFNTEFSWSTDQAMSTARSPFRTVGSLIDYIDGKVHAAA